MQEPLVALLILAAAAGSFWAWLGWRRRRVRRGSSEDLVRAYDVSGTGVLVLAFTTPDCMPCKVLQRPALEDLKRQFPGLIVTGEVDALESPELARRFGILTVPSTVVIGPAGDIRAVNHGAVTAKRLASQAKLNGA